MRDYEPAIEAISNIIRSNEGWAEVSAPVHRGTAALHLRLLRGGDRDEPHLALAAAHLLTALSIELEATAEAEGDRLAAADASEAGPETESAK